MDGLTLGSVVTCCMVRVPPNAEMVVYGSYVRPTTLYGSEAWCLKESEMGILDRIIDIKIFTYLMFMLGLHETIHDQLAMVFSFRWYVHMLK